MRRKHHCRVCGGVFCSSCADASGMAVEVNGQPHRLRVCMTCIALDQGSNASERAELRATLAQEMQTEQSVYSASSVQSAWDNHFAAFGAQDVDKIMLDYSDTSVLKAFDHRTQALVTCTGRGQIRDFFINLFATLSDTSELAAPVIEVTEAPAKQIYLIWSCASSGIVSATDTFMFDDNYKISRQNIAYTSVTQIKIYGAAVSANVMPSMALVLDKQLGSLVPVDLMKGEHTQPEFLALNPFHQVPAMRDGSFSLAEGNAILRYLSRSYAPELYSDMDEAAQTTIDWALDWVSRTPHHSCPRPVL